MLQRNVSYELVQQELMFWALIFAWLTLSLRARNAQIICVITVQASRQVRGCNPFTRSLLIFHRIYKSLRQCSSTYRFILGCVNCAPNIHEISLSLPSSLCVFFGIRESDVAHCSCRLSLKFWTIPSEIGEALV